MRPEMFEVLVIDNGPTASIEAELGCDYPNVLFLWEAKSGSYYARNKGIRLARGEIIAFTDADCIPDRRWLEVGVRSFSIDPKLAYVAGQIRLQFPQGNIKWPVGVFEQLSAFRQKHYLEKSHFGATANVMVRRKAIEDEVGWFDDEADRRDDTQWGQAVFQQGLKQAYLEDAIVEHPSRSLVEILRKHRRIRGRYFYWKLGESTGAWDVLYRILVTEWKPSRSRFRWYLGNSPRTFRNVTAVLLIGTAIHYAELIEMIRIALGKAPIPR